MQLRFGRKQLFPVSHRQFTKTITDFWNAAEQALGVTMNAEILVLRETLHTAGSPEFKGDPRYAEFAEGLAKRQREATLLETDDISDVTKRIWTQAGYASARFHPATTPDFPLSFWWMSAEFLGRHPRALSFNFDAIAEEPKEDEIVRDFNSMMRRNDLRPNGGEIMHYVSVQPEWHGEVRKAIADRARASLLARSPA